MPTTTNFVQSCLLSDVYHWCSACYPLCHCWYPLFLPSAGTHCFCQLCPRHSPFLSSRTFIKVLYLPLQAFYKVLYLPLQALYKQYCICLCRRCYMVPATTISAQSCLLSDVYCWCSAGYPLCQQLSACRRLHFSSLLVPTASADTFSVHSLVPLSGTFSLIIHGYVCRANILQCTAHSARHAKIRVSQCAAA